MFHCAWYKLRGFALRHLQDWASMAIEDAMCYAGNWRTDVAYGCARWKGASIRGFIRSKVPRQSGVQQHLYRTGRASRPEKSIEGSFRLRARPARSNRQNVVATSAKGDNRRLLSHSPRSGVAGCRQAFLRRPAKRFFLLPAGRLSPPQASFFFSIFETIAVSPKILTGAAAED